MSSGGRRPLGRRPLARRAFLATGVGALASLAGCTRLSEFVADSVTGEVNVFNLSERRFSGSLELVGPDDGVLLEESLDLEPGSSEEDDEASAIYDDVLTGAGPHRLTLRLDSTGGGDPTTVSVSETLPVAEPTAEKIVVFLGRELTDEFVTVSVIEDFAELEEEFEGS